ncbi:MAG: putative toxin-antitoxin system toxin component, PIN family [Cyanobacteria bacterium P01_D01_bin.1]
MNTRIRYVFDTNVIVSALLFSNSKPSQALRYAVQHGEILLSLELLEELSDVLGREKFDRFVTSEERDEFSEAFVERAALVEVVDRVQVCRDLKDDKMLELALSGKAEYIVSGDRDLLILHPFRGVKIITADAFLKQCSEE